MNLFQWSVLGLLVLPSALLLIYIRRIWSLLRAVRQGTEESKRALATLDGMRSELKEFGEDALDSVKRGTTSLESAAQSAMQLSHIA